MTSFLVTNTLPCRDCGTAAEEHSACPACGSSPSRSTNPSPQAPAVSPAMVAVQLHLDTALHPRRAPLWHAELVTIRTTPVRGHPDEHTNAEKGARQSDRSGARSDGKVRPSDRGGEINESLPCESPLGRLMQASAGWLGRLIHRLERWAR